MATPVPLKELLKEEQEPFHIQNATFPPTLCRNACLCRNSSDPLLLPVPPKTAALLLQAALRVHNDSKSKARIRNSGLGLLGSLIKRLRIRTRTRNPKTGVSASARASTSCSFCSTTTNDTAAVKQKGEGEKEEVQFLNGLERENSGNNGGIGDEDFPCAVYSSPSPRRRSPTHPNLQEHVNYGQNTPVQSLVEDDEEDKEQNSPISILDPPFQDDDDGEEEDDECHRVEDGFDLECSYAFLQRSKRRVLQRLQKFEMLAELDPTKLECRIIDEEDDIEREARKDDHEFRSMTHGFERNIDFSVDDCCESGLIKELTKPWMKKLVFDMVKEEEERLNCNELVVKRVCKRLESWREVEANTIDMMIGMDFRSESENWKKRAEEEEISRVATKIEFSIFEGLVEELLDQFV